MKLDFSKLPVASSEVTVASSEPSDESAELTKYAPAMSLTERSADPHSGPI